MRISKEYFAENIAKEMLRIRSSSVWFIAQNAIAYHRQAPENWDQTLEILQEIAGGDYNDEGVFIETPPKAE